MYQISDAAITSLARNCTSLTHLSLIGLNRVTDDSIVVLAEFCRQMTTLQFAPNLKTMSSPIQTAKVGDRGFMAIATTMRKLTSLHMACMRRVSDEGAVAIAEGCKGERTALLRVPLSCASGQDA
jgi:F-box/leucine-rich repeat protein 2/20